MQNQSNRQQFLVVQETLLLEKYFKHTYCLERINDHNTLNLFAEAFEKTLKDGSPPTDKFAVVLYGFRHNRRFINLCFDNCNATGTDESTVKIHSYPVHKLAY